MRQMPFEPYLRAIATPPVPIRPPATALAVAVIVPTFDEADNIATLIDRLTVVLAGTAAEIVVVDDWSRDATPRIVEAVARDRRDVRLIRRYGRRGLSSAVIEGILATAAPVVAVIDGDLQHDETVLSQLFAAIATGADVAVGTRYAAGGSCGDWSMRRHRIGAHAATLAGASAVGIGIAIAQALAAAIALLVSALLARASTPRRDRIVWRDLAAGLPGALAAIAIGTAGWFGTDRWNACLAGAAVAALWRTLAPDTTWRR